MKRVALVPGALVGLFLLVVTLARAETPLGDAQILGHASNAIRIQSVTTRISGFDQYGHGYQSQAGPLLGPGSEKLTVLEPQVEVVATQGSRLEHRFTVPVDIVTAASADAIDRHRAKVDAVSGASRVNFAGTFDWSTKYRTSPESDVSVRSGLHLEEPFRSWHVGMAGTHSFAEGDTVLSGSVLEVFDWFDHFDIQGFRTGRINRSTLTGSVGLTQILTPTTIIDANYGITLQRGELGNTWNVVPLSTVKLGPELLPSERVRHAAVFRGSQFLPWNGALRIHYRFYADDWGMRAHSIEGELMQRLAPFLYIGALYRYHRQTGAEFFTTLATPDLRLRTADSDLAPLGAHTVGGSVTLDMPIDAGIRVLHFDIAYERYLRTNDLQMNVVTCATGYRF